MSAWSRPTLGAVVAWRARTLFSAAEPMCADAGTAPTRAIATAVVAARRRCHQRGLVARSG